MSLHGLGQPHNTIIVSDRSYLYPPQRLHDSLKCLLILNALYLTIDAGRFSLTYLRRHILLQCRDPISGHTTLHKHIGNSIILPESLDGEILIAQWQGSKIPHPLCLGAIYILSVTSTLTDSLLYLTGLV